MATPNDQLPKNPIFGETEDVEEEEEYQEERAPRRERPHTTEARAERPTPNKDPPVSMSQLKEFFTEFHHNMVSQMKQMVAESSKTLKEAGQTSKQQPKSPGDDAKNKKIMKKTSPKINWKHITKNTKSVPINPRREIVQGQLSQTYLDAREYLRMKKKGKGTD